MMSVHRRTELLEQARRYAPIMRLDEREPFRPVRVGISKLEETGPSPSFSRQLKLRKPMEAYVLEYAIYWDYDIQHLYDLEHVWVYVGHDGEVLRCEASFHGKFFSGLLPDRGNLIGSRTELYVQAGKHAFSPLPILFELLPDIEVCTTSEAGRGGVLVPSQFQGKFETTEVLDRQAELLLRRYAFEPSHQYEVYRWPEDVWCTWPELAVEIPERMGRLLKELEGNPVGN